MLTIPSPKGIEIALFEAQLIDEVSALMKRNHDRLSRFETVRPYDPDSLARRVAASLRGFIEGRSMEMVIIRGQSPVGMVALRINAHTRTGELACWVDEHSEGDRVARRAVPAVISEGFSRGLHRVEFRIATGNDRSLGAMERLGARREGTLREANGSALGRVDLAVFSVLKHEWPNLRARLDAQLDDQSDKES